MIKRVAFVVEGKGDVRTGPSLLAKTAKMFGQQVYASEPVIRAGEVKKLMRPGELERYIRLAASREGVSEILFLLDLDDLCAAHVSTQFSERANKIRQDVRKPVKFCFCIREYECWLLCDIKTIAAALPEYGISLNSNFADAESIRGAKEVLSGACKDRGYKPMRDQLALTQKISAENLLIRSRSFRKFAKEATGLSYSEIQAFCANVG